MSRQKGTNVPNQPTVPPMPKKRRYIDESALNAKWISCDERLPRNSEKVLIVMEEAGDLYYELGSYESNQWWWLSESSTNYWEMIDDVLAWLPIPRYGSDMRGGA